MAIDWDRLPRDQFERIVEALVYRKYSALGKVEVVDGRGGDAGIDILVTQGSRRRIYQLKHFPDGFSADRGRRRRQIRDSFKRALQHEPQEWVLAVPCKLTPPEREFVNNLAEDDGVKVSVLDRVGLDDALAQAPDLANFLAANGPDDEFIRRVTLFREETAALTRGSADVSDRLTGLGSVIDAQDMYWTLDFAKVGDTVMQIIRAKHPRAAELSPITITLSAAIDGQRPDLVESLNRSLGFGTAESFTLPPEYVTGFKVEGPAWLSRSEEHMEVTWIPAANENIKGKHVGLTVLDDEGKAHRSYSGEATHGGAGGRGYSLKATFYGVLDLEVLLPKDEGTVTLNMQWDARNALPANIVRATEAYEDLYRRPGVRLTLDGRSLCSLRRPAAQADPTGSMAEVRELHDLAEDLAAVQHASGIDFPLPESINGLDRVWLRVVRLMLAGQRVTHPTQSQLEFTLGGGDAPEVREFLDRDARAFFASFEGVQLELGEQVLPLPILSIYSPSVRVPEREAALRALDSGSAEGMRLHVLPSNGGNFSIYLPEYLRGETVPNVTPWGLAGFDEPAGEAVTTPHT